jgi:hypothetical protein
MNTGMNLDELIATVILAASLVLVPARMAAQQTSGGTPVHMIVTAESSGGKQLPAVAREDVLVREGKERRPVTGWAPFQGSNSELELYLLIDDSLGHVFANQIQDVHNFINAQAPSTSIGVAYMRDGTVEIVQKPTPDHASAAKKVRLPQAIPGGGSPYESVMELIKRWPAGSPRREIVMISPGFEPFGITVTNNPFVDEAIAAAQRAGIPVFTAYAPATGHWSHTWWRINWGLTYLSRIADETGGEAYGSTGVVPVSFKGYFDDVTQRLQHQYELTFLANPQPTGLQPVRVTTETPDVDLVAADRVFVTGAK